MASRTIGTSSSPPPSRATSSASQDGSGSIRRTSPTRVSPSHTTQPASSCAQYSPCLERRHVLLAGGELRAAQRLRGGAARVAGEPQDRARVGAGPPLDRDGTPVEQDLRTGAQQARLGPGDVEGAVEPVRAADATRVHRGYSTMSISTRRLSLTAAALITVRSAWAVRPPRPITWP